MNTTYSTTYMFYQYSYTYTPAEEQVAVVKPLDIDTTKRDADVEKCCAALDIDSLKAKAAAMRAARNQQG